MNSAMLNSGDTVFSRNLRRLMEFKGVETIDLARYAKTSEANIKNYLKGHVEPPFVTLVHLSHYFNITIDTMLKHELHNMSDETLERIEEQGVQR